MLYLIPTPIGNMSDITLRAIEILKTVDLILAEDTRQSQKIMQKYEINTTLKSFHSHNEHYKLDQIIVQLREGKQIALVSDAGSPGISDPGFLLVRACKEQQIAVVPLPGPTAFVPALTASGIPSDKFFFEGFLPQKKGRQTRHIYLAQLSHTFILYESPYRLIKCLKELAEHCGLDRYACVCRELTKIHEEIQRDKLENLITFYTDKPSIKGEIVIVVAGNN